MTNLSLNERESLYRVIDANFNRALEGIRVCEDLFRFIWNDSEQMTELRDIRHLLADARKHLDRQELLSARKADVDVGNKLFADEMERSKLDDLMFANIQRVKESLRVLEECLKMFDTELSITMKELRFRLYECEKKINS